MGRTYVQLLHTRETFMMDHIAVMLRGHVRTFHYTHDLIFNFFSKIAHRVDYYIATWRPSSIYLSPYGFFKDQNLITYKNIDVMEDYYSCYLSPAFLSLMLLPHKKQREKEVSYDAVFDTRFDVAPFLLKDNLSVPKKIYKPRANTVYTHNYELHKNNQTNNLDIAVSDWFFMMDSPTYDTMIERITVEDKYGSQVGYLKFAKENNINVNLCDYFFPIMVRPDMVKTDKTQPDLLSKLKQQHSNWGSISYYDKLQILEENKICIFDYITDAKTCSIFATNS